jgi:hypothetical protein
MYQCIKGFWQTEPNPGVADLRALILSNGRRLEARAKFNHTIRGFGAAGLPNRTLTRVRSRKQFSGFISIRSRPTGAAVAPARRRHRLRPAPLPPPRTKDRELGCMEQGISCAIRGSLARRTGNSCVIHPRGLAGCFAKTMVPTREFNRAGARASLWRTPSSSRSAKARRSSALRVAARA